MKSSSEALDEVLLRASFYADTADLHGGFAPLTEQAKARMMEAIRAYKGFRTTPPLGPKAAEKKKRKS